MQTGDGNIDYRYQPDVNATANSGVVAYEYTFENEMNGGTAINLKYIDTTGVNVSYVYRDAPLDTAEGVTGETDFTLQQMSTLGNKKYIYIYILVSPTNTAIPATFTESIKWYVGTPRDMKIVNNINNFCWGFANNCC